MINVLHIFVLQYDSVGWAPKEYNPDEKQSNVQDQTGTEVAVQKDGLAPQQGFVWDEASGYYYDAASGFYYDGNTGMFLCCPENSVRLEFNNAHILR